MGDLSKDVEEMAEVMHGVAQGKRDANWCNDAATLLRTLSTRLAEAKEDCADWNKLYRDACRESGKALARAAAAYEEAAGVADAVFKRRGETPQGYTAESIASDIRALTKPTERDALARVRAEAYKEGIAAGIAAEAAVIERQVKAAFEAGKVAAIRKGD